MNGFVQDLFSAIWRGKPLFRGDRGDECGAPSATRKRDLSHPSRGKRIRRAHSSRHRACRAGGEDRGHESRARGLITTKPPGRDAAATSPKLEPIDPDTDARQSSSVGSDTEAELSPDPISSAADDFGRASAFKYARSPELALAKRRFRDLLEGSGVQVGPAAASAPTVPDEPPSPLVGPTLRPPLRRGYDGLVWDALGSSACSGPRSGSVSAAGADPSSEQGFGWVDGFEYNHTLEERGAGPEGVARETLQVSQPAAPTAPPTVPLSSPRSWAVPATWTQPAWDGSFY